MSKRKTFRKIVLKIHEVLGLLTGLVVFVVAITGCCWVFNEEIQDLLTGQHVIEVQQTPMITPTQARSIAHSVIPDRAVHGTLYGAADEPIEVIFYQPEPEFYQSILLHPYSGEVLQRVDHMSGFFGFVLDGHLHLWLPHDIGSEVVSISVLLFLLILTTGLVLWWPKNKNGRRQRFAFVWKKSTGWKRKNFDLHAITGFYVYGLAFVLAFTGSVMAYDWLSKAVYTAAGGKKEAHFLVPAGTALNRHTAQSESKPIDRLVPALRGQYPSAASFEVHYPHTDSSAIYVEISYSDDVYYNSDYRFYDQNTLAEIGTTSLYGQYDEATVADKLIRMNYDFHVGAIGGLPGKIIAFIASLLTATLPVSGFVLWYGRRVKSRQVRNLESYARSIGVIS